MTKAQFVLLALSLGLTSASAAIAAPAEGPLTMVCRGGGTMTFQYDFNLNPSPAGQATVTNPGVMIFFNKMLAFKAEPNGSNLPSGTCGFVERVMTTTDPNVFTDGKAAPLSVQVLTANNSTSPTSLSVRSTWSTTTLRDQTKFYTAKVVKNSFYWLVQ